MISGGIEINLIRLNSISIKSDIWRRPLTHWANVWQLEQRPWNIFIVLKQILNNSSKNS